MSSEQDENEADQPEEREGLPEALEESLNEEAPSVETATEVEITQAFPEDDNIETWQLQEKEEPAGLRRIREGFVPLIYNPLFLLGLIALLGVVAIIVGLFLVRWIRRSNRKRRWMKENARNAEPDQFEDYEAELPPETETDQDYREDEEYLDNEDEDLEIINMSRELLEADADSSDILELDEPDEMPVISIQDVTMEFHLASSNPSGLKDYLIQLIKREITYRKLFALYHVSFDVYKGEVVGIIGTNGSGKSTLLKIVSGALKPTGGRVDVDRRKVQLLTLGTGFDMELTARENVYLNGSIIGYSREFLDEHYDDIVAFAELEDFMDQKVKNFSSGMVSRLGFAIATAGHAAEILILDEVLSVGDEFFKKKSLARVKEMIHGGSTVLMVSHGMGTILENCSKCVWIEKGELRMVGDPKTVCKAYQDMGAPA